MKINELDEENKAKVLEYYKEYFSKKTDNLQKAFKWRGTKEGLSYLEKLHLKKPNKMKITKEQILKLADIAGDTGRKELEKMFPDAFKIEFDPNKIYVLKNGGFKLVLLNNQQYTFIPVKDTHLNIFRNLPLKDLWKEEDLVVFNTFKEYVEFLNTLIQ